MEGSKFIFGVLYATREKGERLDSSRHLILKSPHPSPLSAFRGFFGSRQFSKANSYLIEQGKSPIEWRL